MMLTSSSTNELISAIASLWKLVLAGAILTGIILFRNSIRLLLSKLRNIRVRRGDSEVSMTADEQTINQEVAEIEEDEVISEVECESVDPEDAPTTDYFTDIEEALRDGNRSRAEEVFLALERSESDTKQRKRNKAEYLYIKYLYGYIEGVLEELLKMSTDDDVAYWARIYLASCYEHSKSYEKALAIYQEVLTEAKDEFKATKIAIQKARCYVAMGENEQALNSLTEHLQGVSEPKLKVLTYKHIAEIQKKLGNTEQQTIVLQKCLEYAPDDIDLLFAAAYAQNKASMSSICIYNYLTVLDFSENHASTLNNLGVECNKIGMKFRSIDYYRRAEQNNETLAMSNLANTFIKTGFEKEARDLLRQALRHENPHENVGVSLSTLEKQKEKEDSDWEEFLEQGRKFKEYIQNYAEAYYTSISNSEELYSGKWNCLSTDNVMIIKVDKDKIFGFWEEQKSEENIDGVNIEGSIINKAAEVRYKSLGGLSVLSSIAKGAKATGYAYLGADGDKLKLCRQSGKKYLYLTLQKCTDEKK